MSYNETNLWQMDKHPDVWQRVKVNKYDDASSVQAVDLTGSSYLDGADILSIVKRTHNLTSLVLAKCSNITDSVVKSIIKESTVLHSLDLSENESLTDASLHSISNYGVMISKLNLTGCSKITRFGVFELVEKCRSLKSLELSLSEEISESIIDTVKSINPRVTVLLQCNV